MLATAFLSQRAEITLDTDIPLMIQVTSDQDQVRSYDVKEGFAHPEYYAGYGGVYAVTLRFCQEPLD